MDTNQDILIVEDEIIIAETIADILSRAGFKNTRIVDSVEGAIAEIETRKPGLVLTDIALGSDRTGIDLGALLHNKYQLPFIYVSSHSSGDLLNKAKLTRPNAYIVKPFKDQDLLVAIELALFNSYHSVPVNKEEEELIVKEGRAMVKISCNHILWLEADGNYTTIILNNGRRRVIRTAISDFEAQLNTQNFIRIHKSYIVNRSHVSSARSGSLFVNDEELPIGRTYQSSISSYFKI